MIRLKQFFNNLSKPKKTRILIIAVLFALILSIGIPSLARYNNRTKPLEVTVWDGSVASNYKSGNGTIDDPYMISNGAELAYFSSQLLTNDYADTYFILSNDIMLNDGVFIYDTVDGMKYIKDDITYYIKPNTSEYYDNNTFEGTAIGDLNILNALNNFKGNLDGKSFTIYGLYMSNSDASELALFTNLGGNINDLYVDNAIINGGYITAGIASTTNNANLINTMFDGFVIGNNSPSTKEKNISLSNKQIEVLNTTISENLTLDVSGVASEQLSSSSLTGTINITNSNLTNTSIMINGNQVLSNDFEISLGNNILNTIPITITTSDANVIVELSNLNYNAKYDYAVASGLVGEASNTIIINSINKGNIYGNLNASGIVGTLINSGIKNTYNTGNITGTTNSSGLVGKIINSNNEVIITNCYNTGLITGTTANGLINTIKNSHSVTISNTFNASETLYTIGIVDTTPVTITNSYTTAGSSIQNGTATGMFKPTTLHDLYDKTVMTNSLDYLEFVNLDNLLTSENSVWVYEDDSLPILYIDNPIVEIYAGTSSWNNLEYDLNNVAFNSNIVFSIQATDLKPLKQISYYVHNSMTPLTKAELSSISTWQEYTSVEEITAEGFYIIYVKATNYEDEIIYLNSDVLILDLSGSSVSLNLNNNTWKTYKSSLDYIYLSEEGVINIEATDNLSGIASTKYYLSNSSLTTEELDTIEEGSWINYTTPIVFNNSTKQIIYTKVIDNSGFVTYANTDYIVYNGYSQSNLTLGRNTNNTLNNIFITSKSTVSFDFTYTDEVSFKTGSTHNLVSNILLPLNTKITLVDKINGKAYTYIINSTEDLYGYNSSCDIADTTCIKKATYPLTLFKSIKVSADEYFSEAEYATSSINEDFKVIVDFSNTNMTENYDNVLLYMAINDVDNNTLRTTLNDTIKTFNIYSSINEESTDGSLYLTTDYDNTTILYNSNSSTNINIQTGINYKYLNGTKIFDTTFENKNIGLLIKLVDENGIVVNKKYLNNIILKIDDTEYAAESDGIFRINLNSGIESVSKTITLTTSEDNIKLPIGNYQLNITNYVSYDGLYTNNLSSNMISVPITVSNSSSSIKYGFDIIMNDNSKIISKQTGLFNTNFVIVQNGALKNPNIRISLYKKDYLTADNQDYSIVNIQNYINNTLKVCEGNTYYAIEKPIKYLGSSATYNNFELTLLTSKFENTGYKFVFELYDGNKKIGAIEKKFIVK